MTMKIPYYSLFVWGLILLPLCSAETSEVRVSASALHSASNAVLGSEKFSYPTGNESIEKYLNPKHFGDPETVKEIKKKLRNGDLVMIRDAFIPDFAEAMHAELLQNLDSYDLKEAYDFHDGFHFHHHNIYPPTSFTPLLNATYDLFNSRATKKFASELSGRDCYGSTHLSTSHYHPRDYSLPHTDFTDDRSVAYVWHLSKDWKAEWGGHLYWCGEHPEHASVAPSFNTLVLFSVTPFSHHLVTAVSPKATGHRLTVNDWWTDDWEPSFEEEDFEEYFESKAELLEVTSDQYEEIQYLGHVCAEKEQPESVSSERCAKIQELAEELDDLFHPEDGDVMIL